MRRYHSIITTAAARVSRNWGNGSIEEIDDVVQEIYLKLCADRRRTLATFRMTQEQAIYGFIKVVATNVARDSFRRKRADKRGADVTGSLDDLAARVGISPDVVRQVTLVQLHEVLALNTQGETGNRDRAIFNFYYRDGMTAQAISQLPGVELSPKGVEAVLQRLTTLLRNAVAPQEIKREIRSEKGGRVEA